MVDPQPGHLLDRLDQQAWPAALERRVELLLFGCNAFAVLGVRRDGHQAVAREAEQDHLVALLGHVHHDRHIRTRATDLVSGAVLVTRAFPRIRADEQVVKRLVRGP